MKKVANCTCNHIPHRDTCAKTIAERRQVRLERRNAERQLAAFKRSTSAGAHKMLDALLNQMGEELIAHALEGRGFRVNIQIVEPNGMPWKPEPPPAPEPEPERLIIMPHEQ